MRAKQLCAFTIVAALAATATAKSGSRWDGKYHGSSAMAGSKAYCPAGAGTLVVSGGHFTVPWTVIPLRDDEDDGPTPSPVRIGTIEGTVADDGSTTVKVTFEDPLPRELAGKLKAESLAQMDTRMKFMKDSYAGGKFGGRAISFNSDNRPAWFGVSGFKGHRVSCVGGWKEEGYKEPPHKSAGCMAGSSCRPDVRGDCAPGGTCIAGQNSMSARFKGKCVCP
jgi:hypothetical protein